MRWPRPSTATIPKDVTVKDKTFTKGQPVSSFPALMDDGSAASGNWLYCQSYNEQGNNMTRRNKEDKSGIGLYSEWAWCWPLNRRIVYNRASVDLDGVPFDKEHPVIAWEVDKWVGERQTLQW